MTWLGRAAVDVWEACVALGYNEGLWDSGITSIASKVGREDLVSKGLT